jgi:hypothetical protein
MSWTDYFEQLRTAFKTGSMVVGDDGKSLNVMCFNGGRQVSFKFDLLPVDAQFVRAKLSRFVFAVVHVARRTYDLDDEIRSLRSELESSRRAPVSPLGGGTLDYAGGGGGGGPYGSPGSRRYGAGGGGALSRSPARTTAGGPRAAPPKRQPGFSIVNPRARRRVVTGAKLAASSATSAAEPVSSVSPRQDNDDTRRDDGDDDDDETEDRPDV